MKSNLYLGTHFDVPVYLNWSFFLLLAFVFGSTYISTDVSSAITSTLFVSAAFGCVLVHEFFHVFAAKYYGIGTQSITIYFIGGLAAIKRIPKEPIKEFVISVAGPISNFLIATICYGIIIYTGGFPDFENASENINILHHPFLAFFYVNLIIGIFNLIPAFPMDGGRMFRSVIGLFTNYLTATKIAVRTAQVFGCIFIVGGFFYMNIVLMLIGAFVVFTGSGEIERVKKLQEDEELTDKLIANIKEYENLKEVFEEFKNKRDQ